MAKISKRKRIIVSILVTALVLFLVYFPAYPLFQVFGLNFTSGAYDPKLFIWLTVLAIGAILTILKILSLDTNFKYFMVLIVLALMIFIEGLLLIIFTHAFDFVLMIISTSRFCSDYSKWMPPGTTKNIEETCAFLHPTFNRF